MCLIWPVQCCLGLEVNGWLINPEEICFYHFHHDPKSSQLYPLVFLDNWIEQSN
ncbi:MAG TPA: DUF1651 domain-containing protein [Prochlorococcus sp.]